MRILLVRHGQSVWNAERRLQGQTDMALSDLGREQAANLAPVIAGFSPDRAITSDLVRAFDTMTILGFPKARRDPALREQNLGIWEGCAIPAIIAKAPDAYAGWRAGTFTPPEGEHWNAFTTRTTAAVQAEQATGNCDNLLVVCHGGVIRALLHGLLGLAPSSIIPVAPASLTTLRLGKGASVARLELFNYRPGQMDLDAPD